MTRDRDSILIIGMALLILGISIAILANDTYAIEGYGELVLDCDKDVAVSGENITCTVQGKVSESDYVSVLDFVIELSENLELVSFTNDTNWSGGIRDGKVELYTDIDKSSNFNIGTFEIAVKDGVINTIESISLKNGVFYTETFVEENINDVNLEISSPSFSSATFDLNNDYIMVNTKAVEDIISNINNELGSIVVWDNLEEITTGDISNGSKLRLKYEDSVIKEYTIIYVGSDKFYFTDDYIVTSVSDLSMVEGDIESINADVSVTEDKLIITYNYNDIRSYQLLNVFSNNYVIDVNKEIIVIDEAVSNNILNNISYSDGVSLNINGDCLEVGYNNQVVRSLKIASLLFDSYDVNLNKGYIYIGNLASDSDIVDNLSRNIDGVALSVNDNQLIVSSNGNELFRIDIVSIGSDNYTIGYVDNYIYTKNISDFEEIKNNMLFTKSSIDFTDNKLVLKYGKEVIKEFNIYNIGVSNYGIKDNTIYVTRNISYNDFITSIKFNGVSYKLYDKDNNEVTSGNVSHGSELKIYYVDSELDSYSVSIQYLEFSDSLNIDSENKVIHRIALGTTYNQLLDSINTSGNIRISDKNNKEVALEKNVRSGDIISIEYYSGTVEYKVSVLGDVVSDGKIDIGDVGKLYQFIKGKRTLTKVEELASNTVNDSKINIGDVGKLYQFIKGKRDSLE